MLAMHIVQRLCLQLLRGKQRSLGDAICLAIWGHPSLQLTSPGSRNKRIQVERNPASPVWSSAGKLECGGQWWAGEGALISLHLSSHRAGEEVGFVGERHARLSHQSFLPWKKIKQTPKQILAPWSNGDQGCLGALLLFVLVLLKLCPGAIRESSFKTGGKDVGEGSVSACSPARLQRGQARDRAALQAWGREA